MTGFDRVAKFGMHLDAGMGADGIAGFGSACTETLNGPAYLFAVHGGEVSGVGGGEGARGGVEVVGGGVVEEGDVAALGGYDSDPCFEGCAAEKDLVGELSSCFGSGGFTCEMKHPAGEEVRELDEVGGEGVTILDACGAQDVDALPDFDPVAGEAAEGFVVIGEEGDGASAGGFAGLDHEFGEELGLVVGGHEGAAAGFDVEDEGVEVFG